MEKVLKEFIQLAVTLTTSVLQGKNEYVENQHISWQLLSQNLVYRKKMKMLEIGHFI